MFGGETHRAIDAVWRIESARLIAGLTRMVRDVGLAEDLAQDALVIALEKWPETGVPDNPGAWLMAVAKRRAIDNVRRDKLQVRKHAEIGYEQDVRQDSAVAELDAAIDDYIGDDVLRLIFMSCHPVLPKEARVALTLRLLGGLTTDEIARAFRGEEFIARLSSVLQVIYLIFNEGYSATAGDDLLRPSLCEEAMRLGRILAALTPGEAEAHGLVALMEIQASRLRARVDFSGAPVLLLDQDRSRWDRILIQHGFSALERAAQLDHTGPYVLQASIAACHASARSGDETDWNRIAALYDTLARVTPSPVVELNRAVAHAMAFGPAAGLALVDRLVADGSLREYHLLPSVRGDLLAKLGRFDEARVELELAGSLTRNSRERQLLKKKADSLGSAAVS